MGRVLGRSVRFLTSPLLPAAAGTIALAYGAVLAWRAEDTRAILAAGAGLFILAVLTGREWEEIEARIGNTALTMRRAVEGVRDVVAEAAASADTPEEAREVLDAARQQLDAAVATTGTADVVRDRLVQNAASRSSGRPSSSGLIYGNAVRRGYAGRDRA